MGLLGKIKDAATDAARDAVSKKAASGSKLAAAAIGATNAVESMNQAKPWINIGAAHWFGPDDEEQEYFGAMIRSALPNYEVYTADGMRLFDITPKMSDFREVELCNGTTVDHLIINRREGDYGIYWRIGFYNWEK